MWSSDNLDDGLSFNSVIPSQNGYANESIKTSMKERQPKEQHSNVPRKIVLITFLFGGHEPSERFSIKLTEAIQTAFPAADI